MNRLAAIMVIVVGAAATAGRASAGSDTHYQDTVIGDRAAGMGGAFTALGNEATGAYYNPAGIVVDKSTLIQVSMSAFKLRYKKLKVVDMCGESVEADDSSFFGFPAAFGFVKLFGQQVRQAVGLTLAVPQSEKASQGTVVRADCGAVQLDAAVARIEVDRLFTVGLSYAIKPWRFISGGMTLGLAARGVTATNILTLIGRAEGATTYPEMTFANVDGTVWSLFFQLGLIVEPTESLRFGLSLTTPYVMLAGGGRYDLGQGSGDPAEWELTSLQAVDDASFNWKVPLRLAIGAAYSRPGRFALSADVSLHPPVAAYRVVDPHPLIDDPTTLERTFVINFNVGGELQLGKRVALRGGLLTNFSSHPTLDINDPDSAYGDHINFFGATLGASVRTNESSTLSLALQGQIGIGDAFKYRISETSDPFAPISESLELADVQAYTLIIAVGGNVDLD